MNYLDRMINAGMRIKTYNFRKLENADDLAQKFITGGEFNDSDIDLAIEDLINLYKLAHTSTVPRAYIRTLVFDLIEFTEGGPVEWEIFEGFWENYVNR